MASQIFVPWATMNTNQAFRAISQAARKEFEGNFRLEWRIGGSMFAGIAAADAVRKSVVPVWTYIEGGAASAGTFISIMGKRRFIDENAMMLIHQLSAEISGNHEEIKEDVQNAEMQMEIIRRLYVNRTKMKEKKVEQCLKRDIWFNAKTAKTLGLVDEII